MQRNARMQKELKMLAEDPPHGVTCWTVDGQIDHLQAKIIGAKGTPYDGGIFKIDIQIPERYPFQPPKMRFITPIYHPNIDSSGRICLDTIKMPPKGMWKPALNVGSVLSTILLLMDKPNPDDPLMADISNQFRYNYSQYVEKAKEWTLKYATDKPVKPDEKLADPDEKQDKQKTNNQTLQTEDSSSSDSESDSENVDKSTRKRLSTEQPSTSGMKPNKIQKL